MVLGPRNFHTGIARFLGLPLRTAEALINSGKIRIDDLNKKTGGSGEAVSHKRAIIPGNYRVHLDAPTRRVLEKQFLRELAFYDAIGGMAFEPYSAYEPPTAISFDFDSGTGEVSEAGAKEWSSLQVTAAVFRPQ